MSRYQNIVEDSCNTRMCTACLIDNSLLQASSLTLRGLCRYSAFDTTFTIHYSPESIISYIGLARTIISYDFPRSTWIMRDVTNPLVSAEAQTPFRTLAIGNIPWTITNDTGCRRGSCYESF